MLGLRHLCLGLRFIDHKVGEVQVVEVNALELLDKYSGDVGLGIERLRQVLEELRSYLVQLDDAILRVGNITVFAFVGNLLQLLQGLRRYSVDKVVKFMIAERLHVRRIKHVMYDRL